MNFDNIFQQFLGMKSFVENWAVHPARKLKWFQSWAMLEMANLTPSTKFSFLMKSLQVNMMKKHFRPLRPQKVAVLWVSGPLSSQDHRR